MRIFAGILIGWVLIAAAGAAYIYSGLYDISAGAGQYGGADGNRAAE